MNAAPTEKILTHSWADRSLCKRCGEPIWTQYDNPHLVWTHIVGGKVECG
jgi:hypothetical protein